MKKTILTFGLISGAINTLWLLSFVVIGIDNVDLDGGEVVGYTAMILSFSLIFFGIKQVREKEYMGAITFGQAFKTGAIIALISSTVYVLVWQVEYFYFIPDFGEKYAACMIEKARTAGASQADITTKMDEMKKFQELYKNPFFNIVVTYAEILPVGLIVSLICSFILRKSQQQTRNK